MITFDVFMIGLFAVSVFTTLTVQAVKKLLRDCGGKISTNLLASIVAIVLSIAACVGYAIVKGIQVDAVYVVCGVALAFLGWLCSLIGYDKVKQAVKQTISGGDIDNLEKDDTIEDSINNILGDDSEV